MSLKKLGSHIITGLSGTRLSDLDKKILQELSPAGVLLLKRNFLQNAPYHQWLDTLRLLLDEVHEYSEREKMIISIDHEGGRVIRTPSPITHYPEAYYWRERSYDIGKAMGIELSSIGVNVSWAPVCDIFSNPKNPVIGKRALSEDPSEVTNFALSFLSGLLESRVQGCIKHFPGHGDTTEDSHLSLPTVAAEKNILEARELFPFREIIKQQIHLIMTAHVMYPALDSSMPATLSKPILTELLRNTYGFNGCIVTDDLDMKAISDRFNLTDTMNHAFNAGCDLFIVARFPDGTSEKPLQLVEAIKQLSSSKTIEESHLRVEAFLKTLVKQSVRELTSDQLKQHNNLAKEVKEQGSKIQTLSPVEDR